MEKVSQIWKDYHSPIILIFLILVFILLIAVLFKGKCENFSIKSLFTKGEPFCHKNVENYTSSSLANIGGLSDYPKNSTYYNPFYPKENFENNSENKTWNEKKTVDRLDRIDAQLLPKISTSVTPYDVDVADPISYTYQVHAPRVIRKDRQAMQADPVRGDIPIAVFPDIPIIGKSSFNRDSLRLDGTFSEALSKSYDRLTGKNNFNMPIMTSTGGMQM